MASDVSVIDLMMIDPDCQRRGLGSDLLRRIEESLGHRYEELRLESFVANQAANTFYRKNGWIEASRYFDEDSRVDKIVFQKVAGRAKP